MKLIGEWVIVRTRSAGVNFGKLLEFAGTTAVLFPSQKIWRWSGANTLHEVAEIGSPGEQTRISKPAPREVVLPEVIEILLVSDQAKKSLEAPRWSRG
jgi:hypothetical protein